MKTEDAIKIIQNKAISPKYAPYMILVLASIFFISGIIQLYYLNKITSLFDFLTWSKIISIALQVEPVKKYSGVELQAVIWLMKSIIYFTISFFLFKGFLLVKRDILICKVISKYLNETVKR